VLPGGDCSQACLSFLWCEHIHVADQTAIFATWLAGLLTRIVLSELLVSLIFFALVLKLGEIGGRGSSQTIEPDKGQWALRLMVLASLYVISTSPLDISLLEKSCCACFSSVRDLTNF
jgi:hypothetical protein